MCFARLQVSGDTLLRIDPLRKAGAAVRVTYGNLKGGVGKSTSSVYTALGLAATGRRVLQQTTADATNWTCLKWSSLAEDWACPR